MSSVQAEAIQGWRANGGKKLMGYRIEGSDVIVFRGRVHRKDEGGQLNLDCDCLAVPMDMDDGSHMVLGVVRRNKQIQTEQE